MQMGQLMDTLSGMAQAQAPGAAGAAEAATSDPDGEETDAPPLKRG